MTLREQFIALVNSDRIVRSDVIIVLEGDGHYRLEKAADLWREGWAPLVVISGGNNDPSAGAYPATRMKKQLQKAGVPSRAILTDETPHNTKEQAVEMLRWAREKKWKRIILVASHYHQYRAFLTFVQEMRNQHMKVILINAPARGLSWFKKTPWGRRIDLLASEFVRIAKYRRKGDVASFAEGIAYLRWKESQIPARYDAQER